MFRRKPPEPQPQVEWLIVGLGNPGSEYKGTRHNVGFDALERLAEKNRIKLNRGRSKALVGTGQVGGKHVALVKPLTFMNLSGQAVSPLAKQMGVPSERILVIADDLDLPLGKVKMKIKGSHGGHNGHRSLIASLRTDDYPRIKIGIGKVDKSETVDHVLGTFDRDERDVANEMLDLTVAAAETVLAESWEAGLRVLERFYAGR